MIYISGFKSNYTNEKQYLENLRKDAKELLEDAPSGSLRIHTKRGKYFFGIADLNNSEEGRTEKYIAETDPKLADYIGKYCAKRVSELVGKALKQITKTPELYDPACIGSLFDSLEVYFGDRVPAPFRSNRQILLQWERSGKTDSFRVDERIFRTERGEWVRSKLECICLNLLYHWGIHYKYEVPIRLKNGRVIHPDVVIYSHVNGRKYYLEICGKMQDPKYTGDLCARLKIMSENGIILGDNLLLVMECDDVPFDTNAFRQMIEHTVLKPL